mmetsp:Transcript_3976/g.7306  ORF Transcript_3976/g.7306 Transcript_3976/m.7306 type:complete len:302 (-) Transcript_3976:63-968(-)
MTTYRAKPVQVFWRSNIRHSITVESVIYYNTSIVALPIMVQVFKQLPWKKEELEQVVTAPFLDKFVHQFKVFHPRDNQDEINVILELSEEKHANQSTFVRLYAFYASHMDGHHICHAFLSDATTGCAVEIFLINCKIISLCRVSRPESKRGWSYGGNALDDGCMVSGIKLSFGGDEREVQSNVVFHCWCQSKPIPFCGDPMSLMYLSLSVSRDADYGTLADLMDARKETPINVQNFREVGLLPVDFVCSLGHSLSPVDASGMVLYGGECPYYKSLFESFVKPGLGIGKWKREGNLFLFRDR